MKKIVKFLKMIGYGILNSIMGLGVAADILMCVTLIKEINAASGWVVLWLFVQLLCFATMGLVVIYGLGSLSIDSNEWIKYKRTYLERDDTSETANETSDEAADDNEWEAKRRSKKK